MPKVIFMDSQSVLECLAISYIKIGNYILYRIKHKLYEEYQVVLGTVS